MPDIRHAITIAAKPQAIYPLCATSQGFARWWAEDVTESKGLVELGFFNRATLYRVRLEIDRAAERAEWLCETGDEWNGTRLEFHLEESASGAELRFAHAGWRAESEYFVHCNTTWGELMYRLKATAEGKAPGPLFAVSALAY